MDKELENKMFNGLMFLANKMRLHEYELDELRDIICNHEFEDYDDGYGNIWKKCKHCGKKTSK